MSLTSGSNVDNYLPTGNNPALALGNGNRMDGSGTIPFLTRGIVAGLNNVEGSVATSENYRSYNIVLGSDNQAAAYNSIVFGNGNAASIAATTYTNGTTHSLVGGTGNTTFALRNGVIIGEGNSLGISGNATTIFNSVIFGSQNVVTNSGSFAMGTQNQVSADDATAIGYGLLADKTKSLVVGKWNAAYDTGDLFVIGNGSSGTRSNALVVKSNGTVNVTSSTLTIGGQQVATTNTSGLANYTATSGLNTYLTGQGFAKTANYTTTTNLDSYISGLTYVKSAVLSSYVTGTSLATTLGSYPTTTAMNTALGSYTTTTNLNSYLTGQGFAKTADYTPTTGLEAKVGTYGYLKSNALSGYVTASSLTVTLGDYATTDDLDTAVVGKLSATTGLDSTVTNGALAAIGNGAVASQAGAVAIGNYNATMQAGDVFAIGSGTDAQNRETALRVTDDGRVILGMPQGDISMGEYQ